MGVPGFFKWITIKYPKVLIDCIEERVVEMAGTRIPLKLTDPNPNGEEFDCLYVDMNGLVHPCCHPEGRPPPATEHDMMMAVFAEVDRLFAAVRPRKVLFLAIDGVAPRAKMNQQRERRFRSAQDAKDAAAEADRLRKSMLASGLKPPPKGDKAWDSNVITPGTPFMEKLTRYLRWYVHDRITHVPAWQKINVILSDSSSPGEGEHKIMEFVRLMRTRPGYNPNWRHVIHGLDADLIMLALATHEAHFFILRELVTFGRKPPKNGGRNKSNNNAGAAHKKQGEFGEHNDAGPTGVIRKPLQFVRIATLREYFDWEFRPESFPTPLPFQHDIERIIDDFVFLCFFVGNDFLPHLPSMSIREGALDLLMGLYRNCLPAIGGYLTDAGELNLKNVSVILGVVGEREDTIFKRRKDREAMMKRRREQNKRTKQADARRNLREGHSRLAAEAAKKMSAPTALGKSKHAKDAVTNSLDVDKALQELAAKEGVAAVVGDGDATQGATASKHAPTTKKKRKRGKDDAPTEEEEEGGSAMKKAATVSTKDGAKAKKKSKKSSNEKSKEGEGEEDRPDDDSDDDDDDDDDLMSLLDGVPASSPSSSAAASTTEIDAKNDSKVEVETDPEAIKAYKEKLKKIIHDKMFVDDVEDKVRLGEEGWKGRYYASKFGDRIHEDGFTYNMWKSYVHGLQWVLRYYYKGCPSWAWFYPYHYSPFASDLRDIEQYGPIEFPPSSPFTPIEQLMSVLPPPSAHCLPKVCRTLMTSPTSPILDFYPETFELDPNGKGVSWLWIALLPFIDADRLQKHVNLVSPFFTPQEIEQSRLKSHVILAHRGLSNLGKHLCDKLPKDGAKSGSSAVATNNAVNEKEDTREKASSNSSSSSSSTAASAASATFLSSEAPLSAGKELYEVNLEGHNIAGKCYYDHVRLHTYPKTYVSPSEVRCDEMYDICNDQVIEAFYDFPPFSTHQCKIMEGVIDPLPALSQQDRLSVRRYAYSGRNSIASLADSSLPSRNASKAWGSQAMPERFQRMNATYQRNQGGGHGWGGRNQNKQFRGPPRRHGGPPLPSGSGHNQNNQFRGPPPQQQNQRQYGRGPPPPRGQYNPFMNSGGGGVPPLLGQVPSPQQQYHSYNGGGPRGPPRQQYPPQQQYQQQQNFQHPQHQQHQQQQQQRHHQQQYYQQQPPAPQQQQQYYQRPPAQQQYYNQAAAPQQQYRYSQHRGPAGGPPPALQQQQTAVAPTVSANQAALANLRAQLLQAHSKR